MNTESLANPHMQPDISCPCGADARYAQCCGRAHAGTAAPTALALMRSRYSAYVLGDADYLLRTWAELTRPVQLNLDVALRWQGMRVLRDAEDGDSAEVEFIARFRKGGRVHVLHETSRFVRSQGAWFYVDGVVA